MQVQDGYQKPGCTWLWVEPHWKGNILPIGSGGRAGTKSGFSQTMCLPLNHHCGQRIRVLWLTRSGSHATSEKRGQTPNPHEMSGLPPKKLCYWSKGKGQAKTEVSTKNSPLIWYFFLGLSLSPLLTPNYPNAGLLWSPLLFPHSTCHASMYIYIFNTCLTHWNVSSLQTHLNPHTYWSMPSPQQVLSKYHQIAFVTEPCGHSFQWVMELGVALMSPESQPRSGIFWKSPPARGCGQHSWSNTGIQPDRFSSKAHLQTIAHEVWPPTFRRSLLIAQPESVWLSTSIRALSSQRSQVQIEILLLNPSMVAGKVLKGNETISTLLFKNCFFCPYLSLWCCILWIFRKSSISLPGAWWGYK